MLSLLKRSKDLHLGVPMVPTTDYINTIATENEPEFPGNEELERRYRAWIRWNAAITVHRAQRPGIGVGGHISTYASSAALYEVGHNWFFRGADHPGGGDQIFYQGHASPGMYGRAYLEGRLTEDQLDGFRQEKSQYPNGLSSYPHPRLMPEFWQFPTVSMGLGPINAIYQAQSNRYLTNRGIKDASDQQVWAFLGDGEMDEVESRGALQWAANEGLDNLNFVINCNLQRLDGPVRGNGKIIQELESFFRGAGWNVIKVVWGREWDELLARDTDGALVDLMNRTPDGDYQTYKAENGAYVRENFFGRDPRVAKLIEDYTDDQLWNLKRGGHDYRKVYAAFKAASEHKGQPTVILAKTVKGYGLGPSFEGRNATHQMKKLTLDNLKQFRDVMRIPITDAELEENPYQPPFYHPGENDEAIQYLQERRRALGGYVPERRSKYTQITLPDASAYEVMKKGSGKQEIATTMAFARLLKDLLRAKDFGHRIVPIIPDEARTFGMDAYFPTAKIYNPAGQHYTSVDRELLLAYKESPQGQIVHVGINEAGAFAAFTAAGTQYATHGEPLIPVYVFYSMFGFQRTGDAMWAAGDQMARGFIIGATAGRTTLTGEGLQHADGHSLLLASTNPAVVSYDPAYGYELGHIVRTGLERMYGGARIPTRTSCTTSRCTTSRSCSRPSPRTSTSTASCAASTCSSAPRRPAPRPSCSRPASPCRGRSRRRSCSPRLGRVGRRVVGHLVDRAAPRRPRRRGAQLPEPEAEQRVPYVTQKLAGCRGTVRRRHRLHARRARPDPPVRARRLRDARCRRLRLLGHARRRPSLLQDRRTVDGRAHARGAREAGHDRPVGGRAGDRQVPAARRERRHHGQRRRRELVRQWPPRAPPRARRRRRSPGCARISGELATRDPQATR